VASGETLAQIARVHGLTIDELLAANPQIADPNRTAVGDELRIPAIGGTSRSPAGQPLLP
jgi:LysM repeat protein